MSLSISNNEVSVVMPGEQCRFYTVHLMYFFFFQAEDGIRDLTVNWSSDVCSSDLPARVASSGQGSFPGDSSARSASWQEFEGEPMFTNSVLPSVESARFLAPCPPAGRSCTTDRKSVV